MVDCTGLLNRRTVIAPYRGFESSISAASQHIEYRLKPFPAQQFQINCHGRGVDR